MAERQSINLRSVVTGIAASLALLSVYFAIVSLAQDFSHAVQTFRDLWYWITALVIGFGVQGGLYYYVRASLIARRASTASVAACGGVSTTAMAACCAHHLSDVLPLLGLSAAAVFLAEYQVLFMVMGVLSNFVGIVFMLGLIQQNKLMNEKGRLAFLFKYDLRAVFLGSLSLAVVIFIALVIAKVNGRF